MLHFSDFDCIFPISPDWLVKKPDTTSRKYVIVSAAPPEAGAETIGLWSKY